MKRKLFAWVMVAVMASAGLCRMRLRRRRDTERRRDGGCGRDDCGR